MIDTKNPRAGIKELRYIDPRKIKKVKAEKRDTRVQASQVSSEVLTKKYEEYYLYQPKGIGSQAQGVKIAKDSIAYLGLWPKKRLFPRAYLKG